MAQQDPGMRALHERDLRNSATPEHVPCVQHVDIEAERARLAAEFADSVEAERERSVTATGEALERGADRGHEHSESEGKRVSDGDEPEPEHG